MKLITNHKKILFLNAIRTDMPSGGLTSTKLFIESIKNKGEVKVISLQPFFDKHNFKIMSFLLALPSPILVVVNRLIRLRLMEFFLRLSPFYAFNLLFKRLVYRPDLVIFNHHASFLYSILFAGIEKIYIWHDLPSLKVINTHSQKTLDRKLTIKIEKGLLMLSDINLVFSFTDKTFMSRFHKKKAYIIPVIEDSLDLRKSKIYENRLLLIGNWSRPENSEGALKFFRLYANRTRSFAKQTKKFSFHIAGSGANDFYQELTQLDFRHLDIHVTERYRKMTDFNEFALIAPLESGAGIKLKTLEAWSASIPVIGTQQAFSGLPKSIWSPGGISESSIECLAALCADHDQFLQKVGRLEASKSFTQYQKIIQNKANWLQ